MYNQYLKILDSKNGKGVFTTVDIPAETPIMEITGDLYTKENMPDSPYLYQISNIWYLGPSGAADDFVNHSCNPNCYLHVVGKRAFLYSLYLIKSDSELTFDYSLSSTESLDTFKLDCNCGDVNCRKIISGFQYLSQQLQEEYKRKNLVPMFISDPRLKNE